MFATPKRTRPTRPITFMAKISIPFPRHSESAYEFKPSMNTSTLPYQHTHTMTMPALPVLFFAHLLVSNYCVIQLVSCRHRKQGARVGRRTTNTPQKARTATDGRDCWLVERVDFGITNDVAKSLGLRDSEISRHGCRSNVL